MITYPRLMPTVGIMSQKFELDRVDYLSPEAGGTLGAISAGVPRWSMTLTLNDMLFDQADIWRAWLRGQRGSQRQFIAFDADRQVPRAYVKGGAYQIAPSSWSQTIASDGSANLSLGGLNSGQIVSVGDYIGFVWSTNKLHLVSALETVAATSGGGVTVAVEPPVPSRVSALATVNLRKACCLMRLTPETALAEQGLGFVAAGSKIVAQQDLVA